MALSPSAKQSLEWALEKANKEGHYVWGFIVNPDQTDFQPFGNATEDVQDFIHNVESGVQILKEAYLAKHEA
jgi:hypothetical protein